MNGATAHVVREAFKVMGYELEIQFFPWNRVIEEATINPDIHGYFPEYASVQRKRTFLFSRSVGKGPLGLAKRKARHLSWKSYSDLKRYTIGTVNGYVNTAKFDALVASGEIVTDTAVSDLYNIRKVLAGRVDMAVVDTNTYAYLLHNDVQLYSRRAELEIDPRLLGINNVYVCLRKGASGDKLLDILNQGLQRVGIQRIQREYLELINSRIQ